MHTPKLKYQFPCIHYGCLLFFFLGSFSPLFAQVRWGTGLGVTNASFRQLSADQLWDKYFFARVEWPLGSSAHFVLAPELFYLPKSNEVTLPDRNKPGALLQGYLETNSAGLLLPLTFWWQEEQFLGFSLGAFGGLAFEGQYKQTDHAPQTMRYNGKNSTWNAGGYAALQYSLGSSELRVAVFQDFTESVLTTAPGFQPNHNWLGRFRVVVLSVGYFFEND